MKLLRYLFFFLTSVVIISACQKQISIENIDSQASGSLLKTASGDCAAVIMGGTYVQNLALGTSNYMDVQVNFTVIGNYEIKTDTVNGYSFKATGQATLSGVQTVRLLATGTPLLAGTNAFVISFNSSVCQANVVVSASSAVYTFGTTGSTCTGATVAGSYFTAVALVPSNTVAIQVNISSPGSYSITSNVVNGMSFSSSGSFTNTGLQTVNLAGSGTPAAAGSFSFNTALTGGCTFVVQVINPLGSLAQLTTTAASAIVCTAAISGGNITNDGGTAINARGVCYSTTANPTTVNTVVNSGSGLGSYTSNITGLTAGTTYHVRAFATNSAGTAYGNDISFATTTGCTTSIFVTGWHDVYDIAGNIRTPKVWVNTTGAYAGTALPFIASSPAEANAIFVSGTDVYVAGKVNQKATIWKNGVASYLSVAPTAPYYYQGDAYSVFVSGTDVYVVGDYANAATIWKNGVATTLSSAALLGSIARSVFVSGTDVYVAGYVTQMINSNVAYVATTWKNGVATSLTNGPVVADANSIFVSGNDVYAVGKEGNAAKLWKNGVATTLSSMSNAVANSIVVSGTDVYVVGTEDDGTSPNSYAKLWKNGTGSFITTSGYHNRAWSVYVLGADVYVAGSKSTGGANTYAGVWKNGFFTAVDGGSTDAAALSIFVK
jgi:hypothetical protein